MKARGMIVGIDLGEDEEGGERFDVTFQATGKAKASGMEQEFSMLVHINVLRAQIKDFKIGDFFEISLEKASLQEV